MSFDLGAEAFGLFTYFERQGGESSPLVLVPVIGNTQCSSQICTTGHMHTIACGYQSKTRWIAYHAHTTYIKIYIEKAPLAIQCVYHYGGEEVSLLSYLNLAASVALSLCVVEGLGWPVFKTSQKFLLLLICFSMTWLAEAAMIGNGFHIPWLRTF